MSSPRGSPFRNTPEHNVSSLRRKDSKHALTTCHGVTSSGRACRRPLAEAAARGARYTIRGTVLVPKKGEDPAVFFCWQHKNQAEDLIEGAEKVEIEERKSLDTVLQGLGLEEVKEEDEDERTKALKRRVMERERLRKAAAGQARLEQRRHKKNGSEGGFLAALFSCFTLDEPSKLGSSSPTRPSRPKPPQGASSSPNRSSRPQIKISEPERTSLPSYQRRRMSDLHAYALSPQDQKPLRVHRDALPDCKSSSLRPPPMTQTHASSAPILPRRKPLTPVNTRERYRRAISAPASTKRPSLLNWTPPLPVTPTDTTRLVYAKLLTAMADPPTQGDLPGYIYMFWQTSLPTSTTESDAAGQVARGTASEDLIQFFESRARRDYSTSPSRTSLTSGQKGATKTVFLKIGRAANVTRRMNQWRNLCGYNISLLRYWPQAPKDVSDSKLGLRIKYVNKVEKLVHLHLEMLGLRVKRECKCGTEHREWFEVQAKAAAVREVDDVIGKWVRWCGEKFGVDDGQDTRGGDDDD